MVCRQNPPAVYCLVDDLLLLWLWKTYDETEAIVFANANNGNKRITCVLWKGSLCNPYRSKTSKPMTSYPEIIWSVSHQSEQKTKANRCTRPDSTWFPFLNITASSAFAYSSAGFEPCLTCRALINDVCVCEWDSVWKMSGYAPLDSQRPQHKHWSELTQELWQQLTSPARSKRRRLAISSS